VLLALVKGHWCRVSCRLRGVRFEAGRNLRVFGTLSIKGPGRVRFGNDVVVDMTVTPWTYDPEATIEVGDGTFLNGTRFGCARSIVIGPRSIVADAAIADTNFHSTAIDRHDHDRRKFRGRVRRSVLWRLPCECPDRAAARDRRASADPVIDYGADDDSGVFPSRTKVSSFGENGVAWLPGPALPPVTAPTPPISAMYCLPSMR